MILNPFSISGQAGLEAVCHLWIFTTVWPSSIPSESNGNIPNVSTAKNTTNSQHKLRLVATSWRGHATNCLPILREWVESGCMTKLRGVIDHSSHSSATTFYCLYIPCSFLFVCIFFFSFCLYDFLLPLWLFIFLFCLYHYFPPPNVLLLFLRLLTDKKALSAEKELIRNVHVYLWFLSLSSTSIVNCVFISFMLLPRTWWLLDENPQCTYAYTLLKSTLQM